MEALTKFCWSSRSSAYFLLVMTYLLSLEIFNWNLHLVDTNYLLTHVHRLSDAALLAFPIMFIRKKWFVYTWLVLINIYLLSNLWYFRNCYHCLF